MNDEGPSDLKYKKKKIILKIEQCQVEKSKAESNTFQVKEMPKRIFCTIYIKPHKLQRNWQPCTRLSKIKKQQILLSVTPEPKTTLGTNERPEQRHAFSDKG